MFISKTLIFLHFEKEGKATGEVLFFFFGFWMMKEIFYWLNILVLHCILNQSERKPEPNVTRLHAFTHAH